MSGTLLGIILGKIEGVKGCRKKTAHKFFTSSRSTLDNIRTWKVSSCISAHIKIVDSRTTALRPFAVNKWFVAEFLNWHLTVPFSQRCKVSFDM